MRSREFASKILNAFTSVHRCSWVVSRKMLSEFSRVFPREMLSVFTSVPESFCSRYCMRSWVFTNTHECFQERCGMCSRLFPRKMTNVFTRIAKHDAERQNNRMLLNRYESLVYKTSACMCYWSLLYITFMYRTTAKYSNTLSWKKILKPLNIQTTWCFF